MFECAAALSVDGDAGARNRVGGIVQLRDARRKSSQEISDD